VLAAVVATELLARLDLASAPHVLAVHPTSSPAPRRWTSLLAHVVCLPRAVSTSLRVHRVGPLVCSPATSGPTGVPASTRRTSHPASWSIVARTTSGAPPGIARRPRDRTVSIEEERTSVPVAVRRGTQDRPRSHTPGRSRRAPGDMQGGPHISWWTVDVAS
jgi:hypothetical protein